MKKIKTIITYVVESYNTENTMKDLTVEELEKEDLKNRDNFEKKVKSDLDELMVLENGLDKSTIEFKYEFSEVENEN